MPEMAELAPDPGASVCTSTSVKSHRLGDAKARKRKFASNVEMNAFNAVR
jgi:hypothetical protein